MVPLEEPWGGWLRPGSERGYNILFGGVQHQMTFFRQENVNRCKYLKNNGYPAKISAPSFLVVGL
jgi:hypothetical protein